MVPPVNSNLEDENSANFIKSLGAAIFKGFLGRTLQGTNGSMFVIIFDVALFYSRQIILN